MTRVASIQMVSSADAGDNLETAADLIRQAAGKRAEFLVLPENFSLMGMDEHDKVAIMEPFGKGPLQDFLTTQARQHGVWLLGGTIPLQANQNDRIRAASLLYNPDGECIARYDKMHLFDVIIDKEHNESYNESNTIEAGEEIIVAETCIGNIGLSVCYDVRFPELYRNMYTRDVQIIAVPSAFTAATGKAHWESLLRARAIENLCYIIASNQGGTHCNGRETWGHSMIIDPWGNILARLEQGPGFAYADVDLAWQKVLRNDFPALNHRKLDYINV